MPVAIRTIFIDKILEKYDKNLIKSNLLEKTINDEKNYKDSNKFIISMILRPRGIY